MYRANDVSFHRPTQPYSLGGVGTIFPGSRPARLPYVVTECLLTRSMLIKMYVHDIYSGFRAGAILSIRQYEHAFITTVSIEFEDSFQS